MDSFLMELLLRLAKNVFSLGINCISHGTRDFAENNILVAQALPSFSKNCDTSAAILIEVGGGSLRPQYH